MSLFSPDSELMQFLGRVADYIILNLLCLLFSVPIITIGAAFTARNYAAMKMVRGEEPDVLKSFLKSFRENFGQITLVWSGALIVILILVFDWYNILYGMGTDMPAVGRIALAIITFIIWAACYCMFYIEARFKVTTKELIKASFLMAVVNLHKMIIIFLAIALPLILCAWYIQWGLGIWLFTTTVSLYYISKEFNSQLLMIQEGRKSE